MARIPPDVKHVCITGGEPFLHLERLFPLVQYLQGVGHKIHWETSGTIAAPSWLRGSNCWITCSPKSGYLRSFVEDVADEIRVMVDKHIKTLPACVENARGQVFLCPISDPYDVSKFDRESIDKCLELIARLPKARISIQMHKILQVR
jgi:organic radical activating enzyme